MAHNFEQYYKAIDNGDIVSLRKLMLKHPNVEKEKKDATDIGFRISPGNFLHRACKSGHLAIVVLLVSEFKYSVDCQLEEEGYPIHIACRNQRLEIVKYLSTFPNQLSKHITSYGGSSPLSLACENVNHDIIKFLVENGAKYEMFVLNFFSFNPIRINENSLLSHLENDMEMVQYMFDKFSLGSSDIPWKQLVDHDNSSLLEYCASRCKDTEFKNYPLVYQAASTSRLKAAETLLKLGVNINKSVGGWTPLIVAARKQPPCQEMVMLLLQWGADTTIRSSTGLTAQELALKEGNPEIASLIANFVPSQADTPNEIQAPSSPKKQKTVFPYSSQLEVLLHMGFIEEAAKNALIANNGNLEQATNSLLM